MYPQSLHTQSPCQYLAAFSASSAFCASVLRFPKTPSEVGTAAVRGATTARVAAGANPNAPVARRHIVEIIAMMFFIVVAGAVF